MDRPSHGWHARRIGLLGKRRVNEPFRGMRQMNGTGPHVHLGRPISRRLLEWLRVSEEGKGGNHSPGPQTFPSR
jgi:hypothetical protein